MPQRPAQRLVVIQQRVEERERERPARGGEYPHRRADHAEGAALQEWLHLIVLQGEAALQEHQGRLQRLAPLRKLVIEN